MRLVSFALVLAACKSERAPAPTPAPAPPPVRVQAPASPGRAAPRSGAQVVDATDLIVRFECARCHAVPAIADAPRDKHCVRCHQDIHDGTFAADAAALAKWRGRITSLRWVPSLAHAGRLRRAWVRDFLLAPHDVRPGLPAEMPRLRMTAADAERLAAHLSPEPDGEHAGGDVARGGELYRSLACGRCHRFTGAAADDAALHAAGRTQSKPDEHALAPDLRHARARLRPEAVAAWIAAPRGAMPDLGISGANARDLAAFVVGTPLAEPARPPAVRRLPVLARAVTWDEVEAKVFRDLCWHCHAVPDYARGDGGPGNSGGFGYAPRGLDVSSYAGIASGALDDGGEPRSVFAPLPDGTPRLVAHLLARHAEAAGDHGPLVGMPLGLPPLPLEDIQLVDTWIAQGRPR